MPAFIERIVNHRLRALIRKEFGQIRRDRRLALSLVLPPTLQLLLLGFALSAIRIQRQARRRRRQPNA